MDSFHHKKKYDRFIEPNYASLNVVNVLFLRDEFQKFADDVMRHVPDEGKPADAHMYNTHMTQFHLALDNAKDHFVKALLAFHSERGSCYK